MAANLIAVKLVDKVCAVVNQTLTYTIVITNCGPDAADNVIFTDIVPTDTTFEPDSFILNGVEQIGADPNVGVNIGTIVAGGFATVLFQVEINCLSATTIISNDASVAFDAVIVTSNTVTTEVLAADDALLQIALDELNIAETLNEQGENIQAAIQSGVSISDLLAVNEAAEEAIEEATDEERELVEQLQDVLECISITP
ncbi:DUF11 domain-containing protein [Paenibacillus sp. GSMTC-2017]|uniref:DUF11 domain-containing protein n=1 Tax=Paenibacillus sp. GSMTC-2017 TaxID=2794350 RepID=UPI0018D9AAE2|nr:DUF11 domain-containing protein [Paenibacillus sp. GSMTC-2017]MBH5316968.1 DUF11 domain-containing protein [Paenibacillus sp. GSMTC-2017]